MIKSYRSDRSIRELIGDIRFLLFVDLKREKYKNNLQQFKGEVYKWNALNEKDSVEDLGKEWKVLEDSEFVKNNI